MAKTYAFLLAGGTGSRLNKTVPKQFLAISRKPILAYSLEKFNSLNIIDQIILVIPDGYLSKVNKIIKKYKITKAVKIIIGGATRQESVYKALSFNFFQNKDFIIIHDTARPFVRTDLIKKCYQEIKSHKAVGLYVPVKETIAEVNLKLISKTLCRDKLYQAQTPQAFTYQIIKKAHEKALKRKEFDSSDDVSLVHKAGYKVKKAEGSYQNIKITSLEDLFLARIMAKKG